MLEPDDGLDPTVTFFSLRVDGELLGIGALKQLEPGHAELKSMHTAVAARGRGAGRALVDHLVEVAAGRGVRRVSLECGAGDAFVPARSLYASGRIRAVWAVRGVRGDPDNVFVTRVLG